MSKLFEVNKFYFGIFVDEFRKKYKELVFIRFILDIIEKFDKLL